MARGSGGLGDWTFDALAWSARTLGGFSPIRRTLADAGMALQRMEPITPSLEDVFIHLIAEEDKRLARTEAA